ncbi:programmed cell death protein 10-like isoform X2 [Stegostoma tigrinum]|uniref:programmed cell death protein 10-like isoform X2 n=1 Tax=Stegostoma tigrinum TaxID=3053191 RepID=UPI002870302A|nr:programmed cell death protein 10-like isoform X2 [Stegostoma tigrinum]
MAMAPVATPTVSMALYTVLYPVFSELEEVDADAAQTLRTVFTEAEVKSPGLCQNVLLKILEQDSVDVDVSYTEALLRMSARDAEGPLDEAGDGVSEMSGLLEKGQALRKALSTIVDSINQRELFIETIRDSGSAMRDFLVTASDLILGSPTERRQELSHREREFVATSKAFRNTVKKHFSEPRNTDVIVGALTLIHQLNLLAQAFTRLW